MTPLTTRRIAALLRRYGRRATLHTEPEACLWVLINETRPYSHPDLPSDSLLADGMALLERADHPAPRSGDSLSLVGTPDNNRWQVRSAVPLDESGSLFRLQLSSHAEAML